MIGGLAGWLLSAYWWNFPEEDMETWRTETILLYSFIGVIGGLIIGGAISLTALALFKTNHDRSKWRLVPMWSGLTLLVVTVATIGYGIFLTPLALLLTALAMRRTEKPWSIPFRLWLVLNLLFGIVFALSIGNSINDNWIAP